MLYEEIKLLHRQLRTKRNRIKNRVFSSSYEDGLRHGERRVLDEMIKTLNLLLIKHKQ